MKQYALDTNIFRHKTDKNNSDDLRTSAEATWKKLIKEVNNGEAVLFVPKEVIRELKVQAFTLTAKQNRKIDDLVNICKVIEPEQYNIDIEYSLRRMTGYIRGTHGANLGQKMDRLEASDARILYTAYNEDSILVTANIKDFMLYPLLFAPYEERLYCMKTNQYIKIPQATHKTIHDDTGFKNLLLEFYELEVNAEVKSK